MSTRPRRKLVRIALRLTLLLSILGESVHALSFEEVLDGMQPYTGVHVPGVDASTLTGKVMCGYQGWFAAEGDNLGRGWVHYGGADFGPGSCTIDMWPDLSEMDEDEKYPTPFKHADGSTAHVFSSGNRKTVERHFKWMQEHGIDGVFLQLFAADTQDPKRLNHRNVVTLNVQAGANLHGRTWAMMYDLSGLGRGQMEQVIFEDWKRLVDRAKIREDKAYQRHDGAPVVAVWGVGFNDGRAYTLEECMRLVEFLKDDPVYGGNTVMLGVPTYWRTLNRDALDDPLLHEIIRKADIVSPWLVGRYRNPEDARENIAHVGSRDMAWCEDQGLDYMRVVFPGFSWHNLMRYRGKAGTLDDIKRLGGDFLWTQAVANKRAGADMLYVAMFDEVDEGTAIFKVDPNPPVGDSPFVTYQDVPPDHYLWLTGQIGKLLRGEVRNTYIQPERN